MNTRLRKSKGNRKDSKKFYRRFTDLLKLQEINSPTPLRPTISEEMLLKGI